MKVKIWAKKVAKVVGVFALAIIAFVCGTVSAGILGGEEKPTTENSLIAENGESHGISMMAADGTNYVGNTLGQSVPYGALQVTATVTPSSASNQKLNWSFAWSSTKSDAVTNYFKLETSGTNAHTAYVWALKPFDVPITVTATSTDGTNKSASMKVDFAKRMTGVTGFDGFGTFDYSSGTLYNISPKEAYGLERIETIMSNAVYIQIVGYDHGASAFSLYLYKVANGALTQVDKIGKYCGYVGYDSYPLLNTSSPWLDYFTLKEHIDNAQRVAEYCEEKGMRFGHVYQTYGNNSRRATTKTDMYWQANIGMAFGVKDHSYYTYYPTVNASAEPDESLYIVDREGNPNERYYWLQEIHEEMQFNAKALLNFEYCASTYALGTGYEWDDEYITRMTRYDLTDVTEVQVEGAGAALVTEQYDKKNKQRGYYVMNATDALYTTELKITLYVDGYDTVQVYNGQKVVERDVKNGKVSFYLPTGQGVFVMPYNK